MIVMYHTFIAEFEGKKEYITSSMTAYGEKNGRFSMHTFTHNPAFFLGGRGGRMSCTLAFFFLVTLGAPARGGKLRWYSVCEDTLPYFHR